MYYKDTVLLRGRRERNVAGLGFRKELKQRPVELPGLSPSPICAPPYGFVSLLSLRRLIPSCILCRRAVKMAASQLVHLQVAAPAT